MIRARPRECIGCLVAACNSLQYDEDFKSREKDLVAELFGKLRGGESRKRSLKALKRKEQGDA